MMMLVEALSSVLIALTVPGTLLLALLTAAACLPARRSPPQVRSLQRVAVVIPAHNEEALIQRTLRSLKADADRRIQLHVIADNCSDRTAALARAEGVTVLERVDSERRGKGWALDYAFAHLMPQGFDAFLIVDADSEVEPGFFDALIERLESGADAVQAAYLPTGSATDTKARLIRIARQAWNVLRLRGRERLGLSVGILGNGFGLTRETLQAVPYISRSIVEDLEYHILLVSAGRRVQFAASAMVRGEMPTEGKALDTQRARWEGGRFRVLADHGRALAGRALRGDMKSAELLGDLTLLPLAYHVGLLVLGLGLALVASAASLQTLVAISLGVLVWHVLIAVVIGDGGWRDLVALLSVPIYILLKISRLGAVLKTARSGANWIRTARDPQQ